MSEQRAHADKDILIVDDTPANLRLLSQMLTEGGYNVRAATSGARALDSVRIAPPSLILLDIRMPEMDGYQVCEQLKADQRSRDIPVIFISALDDIQDKLKAFKVGGVDYITKPFQVEEVLARTEPHLALRQLQKELLDANQKFECELNLAGKMQASFLPAEFPEIPDCEIVAKWRPASETSGDFYDFLPLPGGLLGLLIADVVDKGVGAALFMVLSWSLIRTYAREYLTRPELAFQAVNRRILMDTVAEQFVTVFYGVLDPANGDFIYCNAGHNPPFLMNSQLERGAQRLKATGPPLGIFEDQIWERGSVKILPGDTLVLYTDGVTDAQNSHGEFYDRRRLTRSIESKTAMSALQIRDGILSDVYDFMGDERLFDDIALVVLKRENS